MNNINIIGQVCSKPSFYEQNGKKLVRFHLTTREVIFDLHGNPRKISEKHRIVLGGDAIQLIDNIEVNQTSIAIEGKMKYSYITIRGGQTRCIPEVIANEMVIL